MINKMINNPELNKVREKIDLIDKELLDILVKRFDLVKQVARIKKENNLPIVDPERERKVIESKLDLTDLPDEFVGKLYRLLIDTAVKMEVEDDNNS